MKFLIGLSILFLLAFLESFESYAKANEYLNPTNLLMMAQSGSTGSLNCLSWRLAVETNNLLNWAPVPMECKEYMEDYIMGGQYGQDCLLVTSAAYDYAKSLSLNKGDNNIWVFDIDDTAISHAPYYARPDVGFGTQPYNATSYNEWQEEGIAPPLPAVLRLYKKLVRLGIKIAFISGTTEEYREPKQRNLKEAGYLHWEFLILKQPSESKLKTVEYKSKQRAKLEEMGYKIIGNIGDQWSDLTGSSVGIRTFKIPDPLYYIA